MCGLESKLQVSPLRNPYNTPHITPFKEFTQTTAHVLLRPGLELESELIRAADANGVISVAGCDLSQPPCSFPKWDPDADPKILYCLQLGPPKMVPLILGNSNPYNPLYKHSFHFIFHFFSL